MPVTQRWVHSGLILVAGILSISLTVLILGASRPAVSNAGLVGAAAPVFSLRDSGGWVNLKAARPKTVVLLVAPQRSNLDQQTVGLRKLIEIYAKDQNIQFIGVEFDPDAGLLDSAVHHPGIIETALPGMRALHDVDSSIAVAYRVGTKPVLFVIDGDGIIRARLPLETDGAIVAASESITSLRNAELTMPTTPGDRKLY